MEANNMSTIVLLEMQVKPEAVDEMKAFLKKALPDTRAYDGCQGLDLYGNLDDTGNLVTYQRWASRQHYEKYQAWRTETGGRGSTRCHVGRGADHSVLRAG
jgi:quinol monooxygenase YgiN